jgi:hypothetical protein
MTDRIVIVGGPRTGKSWLAQTYWTAGYDVYCGDPLSKVKDPIETVTYLPEGLAMEDECTRFVVEHWLSQPGPWVCEGWLMARVLRKWLQVHDYEPPTEFPCDKIIVFENQRADCDLLRGQVAMHAGVHKVWNEINDYFSPIAEFR